MGFAYERPGTPAELFAALARGPPGSVAVLAGGTDLVSDLESGRLAAQRVVSLAALPWRELRRADGRLTVGSLLPLRDLERDPALALDLPGLFEAVRAVGSPALRTRATLGGNIGRSASSSDLLPILLALEAEVVLIGPSGERNAPLPELLKRSRRPALGAQELVRSVRVPVRAPSAYAWQRVRPANDISQVGVAVARPADGHGWRVALGGVAPVPQRLPEAERELGDDRPGDGAIEAAREAAARSAPFVSDRRASETYRRRVVRSLTGVALRRALAGPSEGVP